jgi:alkylhydroperoxidase family enzyme
MRSVLVEPLVTPLEKTEAEAAARASGLRDVFAGMQLFRTALRQPGVAQIFATVVEKLVFAGTLDARLRELVLLRVAWLTDGAYEWSNHYPFSKGIGMSDAEILAVRHWQDEDAALDADDRFLLQAVDGILDGLSPSEPEVTRLREIVGGDGPLMEFLIIPGIYHALAMLTETLGIALDPGKEAWLPDGVAPKPARQRDR